MLTLWVIGHFIAGVATGVAFVIWLDSTAYPPVKRQSNGVRAVETTDISKWAQRFYDSTYAP